MDGRHLLVLVLVVPLSLTRSEAEEACRTCHPDIRVEVDAGVHAGEFGCTPCHGGNPIATEPEQAHAPEYGYKGRPARRDIPALCATCHSDPIRMKASGLSTDQYAQYQVSLHGARLALGDARVAVCTDCHGVHRILGRNEPSSPVARQNIATTCGRCHADAEYMAPYDLPTDQVERFRASRHGKALFLQNHPAAPSCATCHGAHGAAAPQVGSIAAVCGHCHARTRQYFNKGAHGKAAAEGKMSECLSCHGHHDGSFADRTLYDKTCSRCHAPESNAIDVAKKLATMLARAEESIQSATDDIDRVEKTFPTVARYRPRLQRARAHLMQALPEQHALSVERLEDQTRQARFIAEEVRAAVHATEGRRKLRYVGLAIVWVFLFLLACLAYLVKLERRRGPSRH